MAARKALAQILRGTVVFLGESAEVSARVIETLAEAQDLDIKNTDEVEKRARSALQELKLLPLLHLRIKI